MPAATTTARRGFHFKDTHDVDTKEEYRSPADAELNASVKRWFWEIGTPRGLVDFRALMDAIVRHGWTGTIVVESDQSPDPAGSVMANGSYVQRVLSRKAAMR